MLKKTHPNSWFIKVHIDSDMARTVLFKPTLNYNMYQFSRYDGYEKEYYKEKVTILQLEIANDNVFLEVIKGDLEYGENKENQEKK